MTCPYIQTSDEGTGFCKLAARNGKTMHDLIAELKAAREALHDAVFAFSHYNIDSEGMSRAEQAIARIDKALTSAD